MAKKRRRHGNFCWCGGRMRWNEKFSGSGHANHLCKDCYKLGSSELQYRKDLRDLERLVTWEGSQEVSLERKVMPKFARLLKIAAKSSLKKQRHFPIERISPLNIERGSLPVRYFT
jgi:hypothetical protein